MRREENDVLAPLPEWWQLERQHGQPVVEILPKAALAAGHGEILAGRRQDPHIHRLAPRASEPAHRVLLDRREQLGLGPLGKEADLVEEERPPVGRLEEPGLGLPSVGERPALEPEQLGLQQGLGNRGAVDVYEGAGCPVAGAVDGAGEQPLAGPRLPLDQHRGEPACIRVALKQPADRLPNGHDPRALSDQLEKGGHAVRYLIPIGLHPALPNFAAGISAPPPASQATGSLTH